MVCPFCHTQNRDNARFCKGCGRLLETPDIQALEETDAPQVVEVVAGQPGATVPVSVDPDQPDASQSEHRQFQAPFPLSSTTTHENEIATPSIEESAETKPTTGELESNDVSNEPTQVLTNEQRDALYVRHQYQQQPTDQNNQSSPAFTGDIADAPTIIVSPAPVNDDTGSDDIHQHDEHTGDLPALETMPAIDSQTESERAETLTASAASPAPVVQNEEEQGVEVSTTDAVAPTIEKEEQESMEPLSQQGAGTDAPVSNDKDDAMAQGQNTAITDVQTTASAVSEPAGANQDGQVQATFPLLDTGAVVGDRYEVTQVVSDSGGEHIYQVADRRGYLHCWNCGSEANAEGDEFCIDCGAELSNASYTMHEYAPASQQNGDAQVLANNIIATFVDHDKTYVVEQEQSIQNSFPNGVHLLSATDSDAGNVRRGEPNEDSTLAFVIERVHESLASPVGLFVVADGMGGHANGQGASRMTIGLIAERIVRELVMPPLSQEKAGEPVKALDEESLASLMQSAVEDANTALVKANQRDQSDAGSTLTGFLIVGDYAYIFNVGDSRTYMLRGEKLYQLTTDHSLVGQLVAGGLIEPEDVYTHPQRNQIFRSIGDKVNVQVDLFKQQVHPGDVLLSCSDGLWEMVHDPQITELLSKAENPQAACSELIEAANANGGEDNVSAVVVMVR